MKIFNEYFRETNDIIERALEIVYDRFSCKIYNINYYNPDFNEAIIYATRELKKEAKK